MRVRYTPDDLDYLVNQSSVSVYQSTYARRPSGHVSIVPILRNIANNEHIRAQTDIYREMLEGQGKLEADKWRKATISVYTPAARFLAGRGKMDYVLSFSHLLFFEYDFKSGDNQDLVGEIKHGLTQDPMVVGCYRSISGQGLHVIRISPTCIESADGYENSWWSTRLLLPHIKHTDTSVKNYNRIVTPAYDPSVYINERYVNDE